MIRVFERFLWYHLGIPFVGLAAVILWLANPALKRSDSTVPSLIVSSVSVWLGGFLIHKSFYLLQLLEILKYRIPFGDPFFRRLMWEYVGWSGLLVVSLVAVSYGNIRRLLGVMIAVATIYVVVYAIGLGGEFWLQHYVFAIPVFAALFMVFVSAAASRPDHVPTRIVGLLVGTSLVLMAAFIPQADYAAKLREAWSAQYETERFFAQQLDALMTDCGYDRYLPIGTEIYAFTKHSPFLLSWEEVRAFGEDYSPRFRNRFMRSLEATSLIVAKPDRLEQIEPGVRNYIEGNFTVTPPPCSADSAIETDSIRVLYRNRGTT